MNNELRELIELLRNRIGDEQFCRILRELDDQTEGCTKRQLEKEVPDLVICGIDEIDGG